MDEQTKQQQAYNQLEKINQKLNKSDLTYFDLIWNSSDHHFLQEYRFTMNNWEAFAPFTEKSLQQFQDIAAKRLFFQQSKEIVFPAINSFLQHAETINEYKGIKRRNDADIPQTDNLYQYYITGLNDKAKRHGVLYLIAEDGVTRVPIDDFIANCKDYKQSENKDGRWQRILKKTNQRFGQSNEVEDEMMSEFLGEIERERLPSLECIGCSPFFYSNTNISAPGINSTPIVPLPSISKIKELQGRLKDEVCWLLNNNGGIILFDCVSRNRDIIPIGSTMSPKLKGEYEQKVMSSILEIYPPPNAYNYSISFVPIVKNALQSRKKQERKKVMEGSTYESIWNDREYIEEVYVLRIKVEPTSGEKLYFWINDSKPIFPLKDNHPKTTFILGIDIRKAIKRRFKDYYVPQDSEQREQDLFLKPKLSYFHKGQCLRPDLGVQVSAPQKKAVVKNQLQIKYPNMSILMAKRSQHEAIVKKLREKGIDCAIQYKFQQHRFRYLSSAAVLYHKLRFDLLLDTIQHKKEFQFAGKYTIILKVTEFIKLVERNVYSILSEIDFKYYQDYFNKEYPNERPILWKYNTGSETEFYCQAGSKSKNLFLYCIMNDNDERVTFKNPKNYDKLTPAAINDRFSLYFPVDLAGSEGELKAGLKGKEKK